MSASVEGPIKNTSAEGDKKRPPAPVNLEGGRRSSDKGGRRPLSKKRGRRRTELRVRERGGLVSLCNGERNSSSTRKSLLAKEESTEKGRSTRGRERGSFSISERPVNIERNPCWGHSIPFNAKRTGKACRQWTARWV